MARGLLYFTIRSGSNLHKHDIFGRQQPYCHVICGQYNCKTKTSKDGGQNPMWNETLFFQVNNETEVNITIYVEQRIGKDAVLGTAVSPIVTVRTTGHQVLSVPVMRRDKQAGLLHLHMEFKGPAVSNIGQIGQVPPGRSGSSSVSLPSQQSSTSTTQPPDPAVRLATLPIRLLQQPTSPLLPPPTQQQQQFRTAANLGSTSGASVPCAAAGGSTAAADARALVLQRQRSALGLPLPQPDHGAVAVQQYSQQLQQLQALHAQLLSSLPPDQQLIILQQQQQGSNARSSSATVPAAAEAAAAEDKLQLPKQPKKKAADLFMPQQQQQHQQQQQLPSSSTADQVLSDVPIRDLLVSGDASSVSCNLDMMRLQAIIDKVYPDQEGTGTGHTTAAAAAAAAGLECDLAAAATIQQQQQRRRPRKAVIAPVAMGDTPSEGTGYIDSFGLGGFCGAAGLAAAAAAAAAADQDAPPPPAVSAAVAAAAAAARDTSKDASGSDNAGLGRVSSTAAWKGAIAADAAPTAIDVVLHGSTTASTIPTAAAVVTDCDLSSIGLGGFGGAAGFAAAAAAAAAASSGSVADLHLSGSAVLDPTPAVTAAAAAECSVTPTVASTFDITSATTLSYSLRSDGTNDLAVALSSVTASSSLTSSTAVPLLPPTAAASPAAAGVGMPGEQLSPQLSAVSVTELGSLRSAAAPVLTQSLYPPSAPSPVAADDEHVRSQPAPTAAAAASGANPSSSSSRVAELEGLLQAVCQDQIRLTLLLQERDQQLQLLTQHYLYSQQQVALLQARLAQMEQQQQLQQAHMW